MIWGYHYFRKHPDESRSSESHPNSFRQAFETANNPPPDHEINSNFEPKKRGGVFEDARFRFGRSFGLLSGGKRDGFVANFWKKDLIGALPLLELILMVSEIQLP